MPDSLTLLHTSDLHGKLTPAKAKAIRELKERSSPSLYFDSGDAIRPGNLAIPARTPADWKLLAEAGCDASVPGNRESHPLALAFRRKIGGARQPMVCANLKTRRGELALPPSVLLHADTIRVGVIGVMVPIVAEHSRSTVVSDFVWEQPIPAARRAAERLRPECDLLIALTHIGLQQDLMLAAECPIFDGILGGHSHKELHEPQMVGPVAVFQAGAFARWAGKYVWRRGEGFEAAELIPLH